MADLDVEAFREAYRREQVGPGYRGGVHLAVTTSGSVLGIALALALAQDVRAMELLVIPFALVLANLVEYLAHRWLMHVPRPVVGFLYKRHALTHHRFFAAGKMTVSSSRDWKAVMFPAPVIFFFLGIIATPVGALVALSTNTNAGALFAATAAGYYLLYEWIHLLWHQPEGSWVEQAPVLRSFRAHHLGHHDDDTRGFNVSVPLFDALLGTLRPRVGQRS